MTKKNTAFVLFSAILTSFVWTTDASASDSCESWGHRSYPVSMQACSYSSGGSGYAVITNDGAKTARICYTIVANNGRELNGCTTLAGGESSTPSCASCGTKNGGARHILLQSYRVE